MENTLEDFLQAIERTNDGWVTSNTVPYPLRVYVDGKEADKVLAVNRKEGIAEIYYDPPRLNETQDEFLTYTAYGHITLEALTNESSPR